VRYKVIDNKRLNVYLTKSDLKRENVTVNDIVDGSEKSVIRIKKIFKVVSRLAHFNMDNKSVSMIIMPVVDGELLISAGILEEKCSYEKVIFLFDDFENVLDVCREVNERGVLSSLYKLDKNYLIVAEATGCPENSFRKICAFMNEYGEKTDYSSYYVTEYGKILIKNQAFEELKEKFLKFR